MGSGGQASGDRVPGTDVAGVVETVGSAVTRFRPRGRGPRRNHPRRAVAQRRRVCDVRHGSGGGRGTQAVRGQLRGSGRGPDRGPDRARQPAAATGAGTATGCWSTARPVASARVALQHRQGVRRRGHRRRPSEQAGARAGRWVRTGPSTTPSRTSPAGRVRWDLVFDVPGNHPFGEVRRALAPGRLPTCWSGTTPSAPPGIAGSAASRASWVWWHARRSSPSCAAAPSRHPTSAS